MRRSVAIRVLTLALALALAFEAGALYGRYLQSLLPSCTIIPTDTGVVMRFCEPPHPIDPFAPLLRG